MIDEKRVEILREILENFGINNMDVLNCLYFGNDLSNFLRNKVVIMPIEYDGLITAQTSNLGEFTDNLLRITSLIRRKQKLYNLYIRYCESFLGSAVNYFDLSIQAVDPKDSLKSDGGFIDYKPYLEALGITDLQHISDQYPGKGR